MDNQRSNKRSDNGNVLFLILIAVMLFAALSYAVTQSTRSDGRVAGNGQLALSGASLVQHPVALRTTLIRMVLSGVQETQLEFNPPADFADLTDPSQGVFHPDGGGAVYQQVKSDLMDNQASGTWHFNAEFAVPEVGTGAASIGNDIIAFLPGVSQAVCERANKDFSISLGHCALQTGSQVPILLSDSAVPDLISTNMDETYNIPTTAPLAIEGQDVGGTCLAFSGQVSGCFYDTKNAQFVVYSVVLER